MIQKIAILGGGTAGLLAALTLRKKRPGLAVEVIRSPDLGVIGVGEGTNISFPQHLHDVLGVSRERFHELVAPTWKLGLRFLWGPRPDFYYGFAREYAMRHRGLTRANACYVTREHGCTGPLSALMAAGKAVLQNGKGGVNWHDGIAYHVENARLVSGLETLCREAGATITDGLVRGAERGPAGVAALVMEDGSRISADLYIDASGFRGELIGKTLGVPWHPFGSSLFCDRAVIGCWERTDEALLPYTTVETMEAGWAWQIEHEHTINRGYVCSSPFISDEAAAAELCARNPRITPDRTRVVKFRTGRRAVCWQDNVVALGNACGFVEPLEATAIQTICTQSATLASALEECQDEPTDSVRLVYNRYNGGQWEEIRNFLAAHYRFNTRRDTPFWQTCRTETDLAGGAELCAWWQEHGPSAMVNGILLSPASPFGLEGWFAILTGQEVPVKRRWQPPGAEAQVWSEAVRGFERLAETRGLTIPEAFALVRR